MCKFKMVSNRRQPQWLRVCVFRRSRQKQKSSSPSLIDWLSSGFIIIIIITVVVVMWTLVFLVVCCLLYVAYVVVNCLCRTRSACKPRFHYVRRLSRDIPVSVHVSLGCLEKVGDLWRESRRRESCHGKVSGFQTITTLSRWFDKKILWQVSDKSMCVVLIEFGNEHDTIRKSGFGPR